MIEDFIDYLQIRSQVKERDLTITGLKMLNHAFRKKFMKVNVLEEVKRTVKGSAKKKNTLLLEEIKLLASTPISDHVKGGTFQYPYRLGMG